MYEFDPNIPIYLQIVNGIKREIVSGARQPGDRLPSVREQAESLAVNPNTVQRAYQELEREGVCDTKRGTGSYISERAGLIPALRDEMARALRRTYAEGMRALGFTDEEILSALRAELDGGRTT